MKVFVFILFLVSFDISAQEISLKNEREGKSFYQSRSIRKSIEKTLKVVSSAQIKEEFLETLNLLGSPNVCSFKINKLFNRKLRSISPDFEQYDGALYQLRAMDELDDVSLNILIKAHAVEVTDLNLPKYKDELWLPTDTKKVDEMIQLISEMEVKLKTGCLDEVYKNLYAEMIKVEKKLKDFHIEALFVEAYEQKKISIETYLILEKARVNELEKYSMDLSSYLKKIKSLRSNFPLKNPDERSDFVTQKFNKSSSRRQHLLQNYTDLQIMLMGNVIKKLRTRLESPKIEILVYEKEDVGEVITLEPMERFRFAIKILRKEMKLLSINTYFNGVTPDYMDLMTSAYETGIIHAEEIAELSSLEDIWNPKKTFWEKAKFWVQSFGAVATVLIPPPYGFIPSLAIVVIEATSKKDNNANDDLGLF